MSRGPGRIQQTIADLIAGDEHGAWTVAQSCEHAYRGVNRVEKKHRVENKGAFGKALIRIELAKESSEIESFECRVPTQENPAKFPWPGAKLR